MNDHTLPLPDVACHDTSVDWHAGHIGRGGNCVVPHAPHFWISSSPRAVPAQNGPVHVSIVDKDMSLDDIKAAIADEGEVTVANWTYTANDQLVKRFQDYVKTVYDVDVKLNAMSSRPNAPASTLAPAAPSTAWVDG